MFIFEQNKENIMSLMDRIYLTDFLSMTDQEKIDLISKVRTIRSSALNAAKVSSKKITKSAMRNIAKTKGTSKAKKMLKDPREAAKKAFAKLTPEQKAAMLAMIPEE